MSADPCAYTHLLKCHKEKREGIVCCDYLFEDGSGIDFTLTWQISLEFIILTTNSSDPFVTCSVL